MSSRMFPESERRLVKSIESLSVNSLDSSLGVEHGERDVRMLWIMSFHDVKMEYRQSIDKDSCGSNLRRLTNCTFTIPVSECERSFNKMNVICNSLRNRRSVNQSHVIS